MKKLPGDLLKKTPWNFVSPKKWEPWETTVLLLQIAHFLKRVIKNVQSHDFYRVFKSF